MGRVSLFSPLVKFVIISISLEDPQNILRRQIEIQEPDFRCVLKILKGKILKVFLHPPPPSEGEDFDKVVEFTISKATILSI